MDDSHRRQRRRRCGAGHGAAALFLCLLSARSASTGCQAFTVPPPGLTATAGRAASAAASAASRLGQRSQREIRPHLRTIGVSSAPERFARRRGEEEDRINGRDDDGDDGDDAARPSLRRAVGRRVRRLRPAALAFLTAASITLSPPAYTGDGFPGGLSSLDLLGGGSPVSFGPPAAMAKTPTQALQDMSGLSRDSVDVAMEKAVEDRQRRRALEMMEHKQEGERIEQEGGKSARDRYEREFQAEKERAVEMKAAKRVRLLNQLLDEGMCPWTDAEGIRQLHLLDEDIDLALVDGTEQSYNRIDILSGRPDKVEKRYGDARFIVKTQVADMRLRGNDPVRYFEEHKGSTDRIYCMPKSQLKKMVDQYKTLIEEHGCLNPLTEAEKEKVAAMEAARAEKKKGATGGSAAKEDAKAERARAKAAARDEKARAKEEAKASKASAKEEKAWAKEAAKVAAAAAAAAATSQAAAATLAAAQSAAAMAASSHAALDSQIAATTGMEFAATAGQEAVTPSAVESASALGGGDEGSGGAAVAVKGERSSALGTATSTKKKGLPIIPAAAVVGLAGGGGYAFKVTRDKAEAEEEERQRQFKLIMGMDDDADAGSALDEDAADTTEPLSEAKAPKARVPSPKVEAPKIEEPIAVPQKKKRGIKSMFSNKSGRESDLSALVRPKAKAPDFSSAIARSLNYGAPGRFPAVDAMGTLMEGEFDLERGNDILAEEMSASGLSEQDAAEAFATVVNCMIVDIVDLASSTLKEKKEKITADAINVVMDFMDHAAGLFEPFLVEGVKINPVTYGGDLGRNKLENLFSTYASAVMSAEGVTQDRIDMLQELFEINDKKAEGLVQKKMMANMMKMMKDPEAMKDMGMGEGMEEMMAAMGGMEGMEGMEGLGAMGEDGEIDPAEIKESVKLMKGLVESGGVSKEEMDVVKSQFKEQYGMDIKEIIDSADSAEVREQLGENGEELIEMFKAILKQTE